MGNHENYERDEKGSGSIAGTSFVTFDSFVVVKKTWAAAACWVRGVRFGFNHRDTEVVVSLQVFVVPPSGGMQLTIPAKAGTANRVAVF